MTVNDGENVKKRRTPEQKYGKYKWMRILIDRQTKKIRDLERLLRGLFLGLSHMMRFDSECLFNLICRDSRDELILDVLVAAGPAGISPKNIHVKVKHRGLEYHHISRRIKRMNKRLEIQIGNRVAEKVGRKWALTQFMLYNWNVSMGEVEHEKATQ